MPARSSIQPQTLNELKTAFEKYRSIQSDSKIIYSEELRLMAVSSLNYFPFAEVLAACEVSPSCLLKWKNRLHQQATQSPRRLCVVKEEQTSVAADAQMSASSEAFLKCPNGLEIKIHQSYVLELLRACGGLK
jgi:hypothetical protein